MPFVERDGEENIIDAFNRPQGNAQEYVSDDDQEYLAYESSRQAAITALDEKAQKLSLKARIDAGTDLGLDMSAEQAELNALLGV